MQTDRDRLINLIINAKRTELETGSFCDYLAEFLLAHGVMLPALIPNEPLTLEQLREMDGEPVWCCGLNDCTVGSWMLVGKRCCENMESVAGFEDYGVEWLAYRRPPEGET